jgi:hypothetical protein
LIDKLIADRDEAWKERDTQTADHEAKMIEHRASFGARTDADAKLIAGLREERNGLLTQVQDMREEIIRVNDAHGRTIVERDALRAEVAALQERLRASIARGDFAQMEVAALKSQTPKHPVKVGEWVRRLVPSPACGVGTVAKVVHVNDNTSKIEYDVKRIDGQHGFWFAKNCEPCDPPEATHDTEAGKAAAQNAEKTEQVADEIKVGDVVEVVSDTECNTWLADVGSIGTVKSIETIDSSVSVRLDAVPGKKNALGGYVSLCDVRTVTT